MFVLDTCFVSEFTRKTPHPGVIGWLDQQVVSDLLITTLTLGEIAKGIERLPMSRKRTDLEIWLAHDLLARFAGSIVSCDEAAGFEWGRLCARLEMGGFMMLRWTRKSQPSACCGERKSSPARSPTSLTRESGS